MAWFRATVDWTTASTGWDFYDPQRGKALVADAVIDNEGELRDILKRPLAAGLPDLLMEGYERWGDDLPKYLVGDFAFAIWDTRQKSIFAARDPFGARSLVYHEGARGLLLASDSEQIRGELSGLDAPDEVTILEYLLWDYRELGRTFFRNIRRLPAGHFLHADERRVRVSRYWWPPSHHVRLPDTEAYHEEFRRVFFDSVRDRLKNTGPTLVHLSGGVDSSSIVCVADALVKRGEAREVRAVSAVYPGLPCDESPFIDAVRRSVGLPCESWDGTLSSNSDLDHPAWVWPNGRTNFAGGTHGDLDWAVRVGAMSILSGSGGDQIGSSDGILRDLGEHRQWMRLLQEVATAPSRTFRQKIAIFVDSMSGSVPAWARRVYRTYRVTLGRPARPVWLSRRLRHLAHERDHRISSAGEIFLSNVQRKRWAGLSSAALGWSIERQQRLAATRGITVRFPFLDARVARFALSVPFEKWPTGGYPERLHRTALAALLPSEILARRTKSRFGGALSLRLRLGAAIVEQLVERGEWASERYVNREGAKILLAKCREPDSVPFWDRYHLWQIATLEAWLRALG